LPKPIGRPRRISRSIAVGGGALSLVLAISAVAQQAASPQPEDTEVWQPEPPRVAPGPPSSSAPPSDALILFDGHDLRQWVSTNDGGPARWTVAGGVLTVHKGTGNIETRRRFRNYQLHLEWRIPRGITGSGQARGNSGVFLAATGPGDAGYELQILDSFRNRTYVNGQAGSLYKQFAPLANATRAPGEWQSYDVVWAAPVFANDGSLVRPAYVTAFLNGVLIQDHVALRGETTYVGQPRYRAHGPAPIKLQDHGDASAPVSFRSIWVRELP
jgi:hypothetical protein